MNGPFRTIAMVCGMLLVVASAVTIAAGLRGGPAGPPRTIAALPTSRATAGPTASPAVTASAVPTASSAPSATASPQPTAAPTARASARPTSRPSYAPLERVPVRSYASSPAATARPAATPAPTNSPPPRTPAATASPARPSPAATESLVGGPDEACVQPLTYLKTAMDDHIGRRAAYNAAVAGLAMNAHCPEPRRSVNEGYLLAMRAPTEFVLHIGDWNADLTRSDTLLEACAASPAFRGTTVAGDCAIQRKFNDTVRKRILQLSGRRPASAR